MISVVVIFVVAILLKKPLLYLLQTPSSILGMADSYLTIIIIGLFVTMAYNMMASMMRSIGDSRTPLYFLIIASILNVALDYIFIAIIRAGGGWCSICYCYCTADKRYPLLSLYA
mgnify:CR=1 FL=1